MGHTKRSPSGYDQWSVCTASPAAVEQDKKSGLIATDDDGSDYAREGTVAHALLAMCLDLHMSPREFMNEEIFVDDLNETFTVDPEMAEEVDKAFEYIMDFVTPGAQVWVEQKMPLDKVLPGEKGTADVVILPADMKRLHVFDLKYGKGKFVSVTNNSQMKLYGIGAFDNLLDRKARTAVKELMLHVVQPRMNNIDNWVFDKGELERFRVEAFQKHRESLDPERRKFVAGEHCWFCDRRARCRTLKESIYSQIIEDPDADAFDAFKNPDSMTNEELAALHPMLSFISAWATNVRKFMETRAAQGEHYPGLKMVEGKKGTRQWKDEKVAEKYLTDKGLTDDQLFKKTLQTPSQAEKIIGRKNLDDEFKKLFTQSDGKPSLAPADDPRPSVDQSLANEFDDLD